MNRMRFVNWRLLIGSVILACLASPLAAQTPAANWLNVKSFGAKGDQVTCDEKAILAAAIAASKMPGGATVYFPGDGRPPVSVYRICTDVVLPDSQSKAWITLWFDGPLDLAAKFQPGNGYILHGGAPWGAVPSFATESGTFFGTYTGGQIYIHGKSSVRIENINLGYGHGIPLVAIDGQSSNIVLHQVYINMGDNGGAPAISVVGGFRIYIEGGGYGGGAYPSMLFSTDPVACNATGIIRIRGVVMAGHGIKVTGKCGTIGGFVIEDVLYENPHDALLTAESTSGGFYPYISGFTIRDSHLADTVGKQPCVNAIGLDNFKAFYIINCFPDSGSPITTGHRIRGLEVWSSNDWIPGIIAQSDLFIYHGPSGIKDTMPKLP